MAFDGALGERNRGVLSRRRVVVLLVVQRKVLLLQMRLLMMHQIGMMKLLLAMKVGDQCMLRRSGGRTNSTEVCALLPAGGLHGVGPCSHAHWWTWAIFSGGQGHTNRWDVPAQDPATPAARRPQSLSQIWARTQRSGSEMETVFLTAEIWGRGGFGFECHGAFSPLDAHGHSGKAQRP